PIIRAMGTRRWILWQGLVAPSMERFIVRTSGDGFELSGLILQAHEEAPYVVRYRIEVDAGWRTRNVEVELEDGGQRRLSLTADLAVDDDGMVLQYGVNWKAVATSGELG